MIQADGKIDDVFGMELVLNLYDCDGKKVSQAKSIRQFAVKLCDEVIGMKRYGRTLIPHFGHDNPITSGYSLVQLIETSSVTAHFSESKRAVYLNIFSCKWFDAGKAAQFCKEWFGAKAMTKRLLPRL